ncbi:putative phosphate transporter family protein [Trichinella spiralis]|uniref:putative phosphate transporter family protein n=1 Tax=Trichinella spiralis TaxID=6334 RepID=UPI0001EFE024|nr:putative phosphate transporter family protein [Trichinella spiralis]
MVLLLSLVMVVSVGDLSSLIRREKFTMTFNSTINDRRRTMGQVGCTLASFQFHRTSVADVDTVHLTFRAYFLLVFFNFAPVHGRFTTVGTQSHRTLVFENLANCSKTRFAMVVQKWRHDK